MFAPNSADDVLLGFPSNTSDGATTCYSSKIGGSPLWISSDSSPCVPWHCSQCKRKMIFLMQIYAPTDDVERALYIYCCPSSCATQSHGWQVLKDQCSKRTRGKEAAKQTTSVVEAQINVQIKTDWLGVCAPTASKSSGGFNLDDESDDDDFSALTALIDAREDSLRGVASSTTKPTVPPASSALPAADSLPPPPHQLAEKPSRDRSNSLVVVPETLLTEAYESECAVSSSSQSSHVDDLFEKYLNETISLGDEDPAVIALLQQQQHQRSKATQSKKHQASAAHDDSDDDDFEDKDDEEFNNSIRQMHVKSSNKSSTSQSNMSKSDWAKRRKAEEYFQKRFSMAPSQVMRYAYGGSPMWCSLPAPRTDRSSVPPCPCCGVARVFELQLMPALVGFMEGASAHAAPAPAPVAPQAATSSALDLSDIAGFDFGVVCIWSCPSSCSGSSHEVAVAQATAE